MASVLVAALVVVGAGCEPEPSPNTRFGLGPAAIEPGLLARAVVYNTCDSAAEARVELRDGRTGEVRKEANFDALQSGLAAEVGVGASAPTQLVALIDFRCLEGPPQVPLATLQVVDSATQQTQITLELRRNNP